MERIIVDQLLIYLQQNDIISSEQHGFLARRSTCTQLLDTVHDWVLDINRHLRIDCVYIDFAKAFDTVSHSKLLTKLNGYGVEYELLNWVSSFLSGRTQQVCIGNELSNGILVESGVPQGSVLGPLAFLLYINDIVNCNLGLTKCKLFADDSKFYCTQDLTISNHDLSSTLTMFEHWAGTWQMSIAFHKCYVQSIGNLNIPS